MIVNGKKVFVFASMKAEEIPWSEVGADRPVEMVAGRQSVGGVASAGLPPVVGAGSMGRGGWAPLRLQACMPGLGPCRRSWRRPGKRSILPLLRGWAPPANCSLQAKEVAKGVGGGGQLACLWEAVGLQGKPTERFGGGAETAQLRRANSWAPT